ncbi:cell division protein FtsQ/DivIB [Thermomonas alba]|uniref:cell division protein FtsQ/DivIB n=1 Tax=Thermomonas alba TaxID=2888525 RepID=UPI001F04DC6F|nr:cell division protein FtsQ/DivIB [Thermomonas alba]
MSAWRMPLIWLLALVTVALPVVGVVDGWWLTAHFPLRTLRVQGELQRVDRAQLRATVLPYAQRGFFAVDLGQVQRAVSRLPWVERVQVRKHWPDVLELRISEYRPFARWGATRLLSERGHLFPAGKVQVPAGLPLLDGPEARVPEVVALYDQAREQLASVGGVRGVVIDRRGSWSITLADGTQVVLGRDAPSARLERFAALLPQLIAHDPQRRLLRADLRYTNGFALSWASAPGPAAPAGATPAAAASIPHSNTGSKT